MRFLLLTIISLVAMNMAQAESLTAAKAFTEAPIDVFPLLDEGIRLDMIDYFESGSSTASTNALNGKSRITAMSPTSLTISLTDASSSQLVVLPTSGDTLIAVITTVATPVPDSSMAIYSSDWERNLTSSLWKAPILDDWLTAAGRTNRGEVEGLVPFMLVEYSYDPATNTLTLTNNTRAFLSDDVYSLVQDYLYNTLAYSWNGKQFARNKK